MNIPLIKTAFFDDANTRKILADFILNSDRLSMGDQTKKWESEFAAWHNRKFSVFVNSGSSANLLLIQSLLSRNILSKGDKVAFTSVTWSTNIMPLIQLGLVPIPVDVSLNSFNSSLFELQNVHNKHPDLKAFFITNVLGFAEDLPDIERYCSSNQILLLEDNCESLGSEFDSKLLGNFGLASTCSTFVGHHLSTVEGGFVLTDDFDLYITLQSCRAHGWARSWPEEIQKLYRERFGISEFNSLYTFYNIGMNLRPTEMASVLGLAQLKFLSNNVDRRHSIYSYFFDKIRNAPFKMPCNPSMNKVSAFSLPLLFSESQHREKAIAYFESLGIDTRPLVSGNILRQPFAINCLGDFSGLLPNADILHDFGLYIACRPDFSENEVEYLEKSLSGLINLLN